MKGLKRTVRKHGRVLGHQAGVESEDLLPYVEARKRIYLPAYTWVLKNSERYIIGVLTWRGGFG